MRSVYLWALSLTFIVGLWSCSNEESPQQRIVGTWVGEDYPDVDTAFFNADNTARFTGRAGNGNTVNYLIHDMEIEFFSDTSVSVRRRYEFIGNQLYIDGLTTSVGFEDDGILFNKK